MSEAERWASTHYPDEEEKRIALRFALILESQINVPLNRFTKNTSFLDDLQMDELEPVEVAMAIEEEFQIPEIEEADAVKMVVFDDVVSYLLKKANASEQ